MNASQNKCSGFTKLSTDFSTSYFVDNVYNSVYNSIFSHFLHFSMWITFFRPPVHPAGPPRRPGGGAGQAPTADRLGEGDDPNTRKG